MSIFKKDTLEDILKKIEALSDEEKAKLKEMLAEPQEEEEVPEDAETEEVEEEVKEEPEEAEVDEKAEPAEVAEEEVAEEEVAEDAPIEPEAEAEPIAEEPQEEVVDEEAVQEQEDAKDARIEALEADIASLKEQVARCVEMFDNGSFGGKASPNPNTNEEEWVGKHTQAYLGRK